MGRPKANIDWHKVDNLLKAQCDGVGEWDFSMLANEWDAGKLGEWGLDTEKHEEKEIKTFEVAPFKKTHILFSFSPDVFIKIADYVEKIREVSGVEYEQASN
jgi:hypothetical protein